MFSVTKKNLSPSAPQSNQCLFLKCSLFIVEAKWPVPAVTVLPKLMPLWCALDHNTSRISFFVLSHGEYDPTERDSFRLLRYCLRRTSYCRTWWQFLSMAQAFLLLSHSEQKKKIADFSGWWFRRKTWPNIASSWLIRGVDDVHNDTNPLGVGLNSPGGRWFPQWHRRKKEIDSDKMRLHDGTVNLMTCSDIRYFGRNSDRMPEGQPRNSITFHVNDFLEGIGDIKWSTTAISPKPGILN